MTLARSVLASATAAALAGLAALGVGAAGTGTAGLRIQRFDRDPGWEGRNNQLGKLPPRSIRQDFGYSRTQHAGGGIGEVGGFVTPAAEPAFYARAIAPTTLERPFAASGKLVVGRGSSNTLVGFFNVGTAKEWRTASAVVLRLQGRGDGFHAHVEYATSRWRAGAGCFMQPAAGDEKPEMRLVASDQPHTWSLRYDPEANGGNGAITAMLDGESVAVNVGSEMRADGAALNHFGILNVMKSADGGGEIWLDDLMIQGVREAFDQDPRWQGQRNRVVYPTTNIRPHFHFGFSRTRHAGGKAAGELGGLVFRGDERYPDKMACYGDRVGPFTLEQPLRAGGRVALLRGVTDSTTLIGFYHSRGSMGVSTAQRSALPENFLGVAIEGPSREGFFFYPACGLDADSESLDALRSRASGQPPRIYPDGRSHRWELAYSPAEGPAGRVTVSLDGRSVSMNLERRHRDLGARFDRFGIVTTHIDGNGQQVYFDDLVYSGEAEPG